MDDASAAPYAGLTPDRVLDALDAVGFFGDGRLLALNSYENRVYQAWLTTARRTPATGPPHRSSPSSIARRAGPTTQIGEEHAFVAELAAREIPVVAPLAAAGGATLHRFAGFRFAVYPQRGGRAPELEDRATLEWIGRFIGRIHARRRDRAVPPATALDVASFGDEPRDWLLAHGFIPPDLAPPGKACRAGARARAALLRRAPARCDNAAPARRLPRRQRAVDRRADAGPHFVDFDDCRSGPAVQDLWMLLSGERADMQRQLRAVLAGYEDFCEFDGRELHLVEALRTLRLIHYSAWLARRWDDPAFPAAFPWFNTQRYWQDRILELREQIALMDEPPLAV